MRRVNIKRFQNAALQQIPISAAVLAGFSLLGILAGYFFAGDCAPRLNAELAQYWLGSMSAGAIDRFSAQMIWKTFVCFFRAPAAAFFAGLISTGFLLLPIVCAVQSFLLSFSFFSFAALLGTGGYWPLSALFSVRLLLVLPCTLYLGAAAWDHSCQLRRPTGGKRKQKSADYRTPYGMTAAVCGVMLLLGAAFELWIAPQLLLRLAG